MNNNDRDLLIKLDERVKNKLEDLHDDIKEIKTNVQNINGRVRENEKDISNNNLAFKIHIKTHKQPNGEKKKRSWLGSIIKIGD